MLRCCSSQSRILSLWQQQPTASSPTVLVAAVQQQLAAPQKPDQPTQHRDLSIIAAIPTEKWWNSFLKLLSGWEWHQPSFNQSCEWVAIRFVRINYLVIIALNVFMDTECVACYYLPVLSFQWTYSVFRTQADSVPIMYVKNSHYFSDNVCLSSWLEWPLCVCAPHYHCFK